MTFRGRIENGVMIGSGPILAKPQNIIRAEMKRRNLTYKHLVRMLAADGYRTDESNLANRVSRGTMSAAFWLRCLTVMGCERVQIT